MKSNFDNALQYVLSTTHVWVADYQHEVYSKYGVSLSSFRLEFGQYMEVPDLQNASEGQIRQVYKNQYWKPSKCNGLPLGIDFFVFDMATHLNSHLALSLLFKALGVDNPYTLKRKARKQALHRVWDTTLHTLLLKMAEGRRAYHNHFRKPKGRHPDGMIDQWDFRLSEALWYSMGQILEIKGWNGKAFDQCIGVGSAGGGPRGNTEYEDRREAWGE